MPPELFEALAATWPAAETIRLGPFTLRRGAGGGNRTSAATLDGPPTSWASVIPTALPLPGIGRDATGGLRSSAAPARSGTVGPEIRLAVDELPEMPRREMRVVRFDEVGLSIPAVLTGWTPRRPPLVIDRDPTVLPAAWVAEAALRIP